MFQEDVATLNGHSESAVFAPAEAAQESALWPVREIWATAAESVPSATSEETFEDMAYETGQQLGSFEDTVTEFSAEYPASEYSGTEYAGGENAAESVGAGYPGSEHVASEYVGSEYLPGMAPAGEHLQVGAYEESALENMSLENALLEETTLENASLESVHGAEESAYEDTAYAETAFEETAFENPSLENPAAETSGYENGTLEQTGYEQTGYEQTGYEDISFGESQETAATVASEYPQESSFESAYESAYESPYESANESGAAAPTEFNAEILEWPGEVLAEDWAVSGEMALHAESQFGMPESLQEQSRRQVPAGMRSVSNFPLLRTHRGTQPDLVLRWTAMPAATTTVDVVVHLHGYSASGPRMQIQDKAAMSGMDFPQSPTSGGTGRPMLGLIPRGSFFGGQSGAGYNFPALVGPGAIQRLVAGGLDLLRTHTGVRARVGRLILTGHSGGGAPVNAILAHTDADEVHLFDGSYGDMSNVIAWARRRIAGGSRSALRVLFRPNSGTAHHALAIAAAICPPITAAPNAPAVHRRFRVEATSVEHNLIPRTFGGRLLADPGADLPGAVRQGCGHRGSRPSGGPTAPASPAAQIAPGPSGTPTGPITRTPDRIAGIVRVTPYSKDGTRALPGAVALAAQWRRLTARAAGTFNPRNTSFGTRSLHSEGRAIDCHGSVSKPSEAAQAQAYIGWLMANAVELQVSTIIWNRRIWSWPRRAQGWRSYMTRPQHNPHTDHFHVDLSWEGALHPSPLFSGSVPGVAAGGRNAPAGSRPAPAGSRGRPAAAPAAPSGSAAASGSAASHDSGAVAPRPGPAGSGSASPPGTRRTPADFVRLFGPFAKASEARTGVPGLVTLAQAAVESGWGAKAQGNNFFGIKARASDAPGTRQLWRTREVLSRPDVRSFPEVISVTPRPDGRYNYIVRDWFRVFPSPELAFVGHGEFLRRNRRYAPAFDFVRDPYRFAAEVARAGYATDPGYTTVVHSVMRLLERNGWR